MQYHVSVRLLVFFVKVLYIPMYSTVSFSYYVSTANTRSDITEVYGAQARCYEHSDECNSTVSFSCLATQVVQHEASQLLAYYININGKYYHCYYNLSSYKHINIDSEEASLRSPLGSVFFLR